MYSNMDTNIDDLYLPLTSTFEEHHLYKQHFTADLNGLWERRLVELGDLKTNPS